MYHKGFFIMKIADTIKRRDAYDFMKIICKISMAFQNMKTISQGKLLTAH